MNARVLSPRASARTTLRTTTSTTPSRTARLLSHRARVCGRRLVASRRPPVRASFANTHIDRRQISFVWYYISYTDIKTKIYVHITNDIYPKPSRAKKTLHSKKIIEKARTTQTLSRATRRCDDIFSQFFSPYIHLIIDTIRTCKRMPSHTKTSVARARAR